MRSTPTGWTEPRSGVHRLDVAHVNCYLIEAEGGLTLIDAGLPRSIRLLGALLQRIGASVRDIDAVLLTHGHFDHVGMARRLADRGVASLVHPDDERLARHPYRYAHEAPIWSYPLRHPRILPSMISMVCPGALAVKGVDASPGVADGEVLDVPGHPRAIWTPGHTNGHCGYYFEKADVLFCGDAIVTLDPYTGSRGAQIVAGAATADSTRALASLDALRAADAAVLLPGHGEPWTDGVGSAIDAALRAGAH